MALGFRRSHSPTPPEVGSPSPDPLPMSQFVMRSSSPRLKERAKLLKPRLPTPLSVTASLKHYGWNAEANIISRRTHSVGQPLSPPHLQKTHTHLATHPTAAMAVSQAVLARTIDLKHRTTIDKVPPLANPPCQEIHLDFQVRDPRQRWNTISKTVTNPDLREGGTVRLYLLPYRLAMLQIKDVHPFRAERPVGHHRVLL